MIMNGFKGSTLQTSNTITASFDPTSQNYFGNKLNKDPFKIEEYGHLLYSSYEIHPNLAEITGSGIVRTERHTAFENTAFILTSSNPRALSSGLGNIPDYEDFQDRFSNAESPFIISQDLGVNYDLFKLIALSPGEEFSRKYKFTIENINRSAKTFSLYLRKRNDTDTNQVEVSGERYDGLSLDANDQNYIARRIGDMNTKYDFDTSDSSQKIITEGSHPNISKLFRVKISNDLENGNVPTTALPFGFRGVRHLVTSGTLLCGNNHAEYGDADILQRVVEPPIPFRENISKGEGFKKQVNASLNWGIQTEFKFNLTDINKLDNSDINDPISAYVKHFPTHRSDTTGFAVKDNTGASNINGSVIDCDKFNLNIFSLEHIKVVTGSDAISNRADPEQWVSASYVRAGGIGTDDNLRTKAFEPSDLDISANMNYAKFNCIFQGGFNGTNVFDKDKFNLTNNAVKREYDNASTQGGVTSGPTIKSYRKALDVLGSKTDVDIQLLAIPGIRHSAVTDYAIDTVENRFDSLLIMDVEERDSNNIVITGSNDTPSITYTTTNFNNRSLDSSFAAAYFPDVNSAVRLADGSIINKRLPPTVSVLGAYANNDNIGASWFAPAGQNRGILDSATSTSLGVLSRENMDKLYEADINPIQTSLGSGVTIQGQKTLLSDLSALDRVNVRRLLISIRRSVRNIANSLIFEPNRTETLDKFRSQINPILQGLKNQQGISRYKVVIDSTTTTQADIENNTVRGKIFIQPVRVAEFIALDFNITNQIID